jgi:hypothetical protein
MPAGTGVNEGVITLARSRRELQRASIVDRIVDHGSVEQGGPIGTELGEPVGPRALGVRRELLVDFMPAYRSIELVCRAPDYENIIAGAL